MTQDEFQTVMQSIQALDHFASTSDTLNTHRVWHANWVRAYETVGQQLSKLVDKPAEKPTETSNKIDGALCKITESGTPGENPDPPPSKRRPEPPPNWPNETTTGGAPPPSKRRPESIPEPPPPPYVRPNKPIAKAPK